jgi:hypothetical protein
MKWGKDNPTLTHGTQRRRGWKPVRKIVAAFVASGIMYAARRAGVDVGDDAANEAAVWLVGIAAGYWVK